jgi:NaMN:DMB phosphoribosyltransferase
MKLIAEATLRAIQSSALSDAVFILEDVDEITIGGRRVAVVLVSTFTDRGENILVGSAVIKQDIWKGVVNATLDAVNRRLFVSHER